MAAYAARAGLERAGLHAEGREAAVHPRVRAVRRRGHARRRADHRRGTDRRRARQDRSAGTTSRRSRSRTASKARRRWATSWPNSSSWTLPDWIIYPTGGGTGMVGMWKAFAEMSALGWIDPVRRPQHGHRAGGGLRADRPGVRRRRREGGAVGERAHRSPTACACRRRSAISSSCARVRESDGAAVAVGDAEMVAGMRDLGRLEGISAAPEGGAALHALRVLISEGRIKPHDSVVAVQHGRRAEVPGRAEPMTGKARHTPQAQGPGPRPRLRRALDLAVSMIGLLFTGGTISMKLDPATGAAVPALGAAEILAQVPDLDRSPTSKSRTSPGCRARTSRRSRCGGSRGARRPGSSGPTSTAS